ncbi:hypothetical protein NPIL_464721 [Nephila pilipes]|uniref:Uncharacterized protein n=1 Tax=Nephila pilipes TaxID=299642 RepID=A0A8X6TWG5_NEPPI|nr:hypothetical protein NPIL_464721 [Nephila pilipes]
MGDEIRHIDFLVEPLSLTCISFLAFWSTDTRVDAAFFYLFYGFIINSWKVYYLFPPVFLKLILYAEENVIGTDAYESAMKPASELKLKVNYFKLVVDDAISLRSASNSRKHSSRLFLRFLCMMPTPWYPANSPSDLQCK